MTLSEAISRTVSSILEARRMDTKTFATRLPYAKSTVYRQLAGTTKIASDDIEHLASALGMETVELVSRALALRTEIGSLSPQEAEARQFMGEEAWTELQATRQSHKSQKRRKA